MDEALGALMYPGLRPGRGESGSGATLPESPGSFAATNDVTLTGLDGEGHATPDPTTCVVVCGGVWLFFENSTVCVFVGAMLFVFGFFG